MKAIKYLKIFLLSSLVILALVAKVPAQVTGHTEFVRPDIHSQVRPEKLFNARFRRVSSETGSAGSTKHILGTAADQLLQFLENSMPADDLGNQVLVPGCMIEASDIGIALWDLFTDFFLTEHSGPECFLLSATGKSFYVVESLMAYRICVLRTEEEPDEKQIGLLQTNRKILMAIDEFLYIIELLLCYDSNES